MRILFLSTVYPRPYTRTLGVYCRALCRGLVSRHAVRVVAPVNWPERFKQGRLADGPGTEGADAEISVSYPTHYYPPKVGRSRYGSFLWWSIRGHVRRVLNSFRPDCVLSYWLHPDGEAAIRAARVHGVPSAVIVGGSDALLLPKDPKRRRRIVAVLQQADALITVSEGLKQAIVELGAAADKVHVIYQGIDRSIFHPGERGDVRKKLGLDAKRPVLVWVGGMVPVKGLDVLLAAGKRLKDRGNEFQLALIGDGPLRSRLEAQAESLGLKPNVRFVGGLAHAELADWYRAADLTVLSSHSEGIPNVLRESVACGTPFVATRVGDIAELFPDVAAELVPPNDADALAAALERNIRVRPTLPRLNGPTSWNEYAEAVADVLGSLKTSPESATAELASTPR